MAIYIKTYVFDQNMYVDIDQNWNLKKDTVKRS